MANTQKLTINAKAIDNVNFASAQNSVPIIQELYIDNISLEDVSSIKIELKAQPGFCRSKKWTIDRLASGTQVSLSDLRLEYDLGFFSGLNEAEVGQLAFSLKSDETLIAESVIPLRLLARDEWGGSGGMPSLLAAFVTPNDPNTAYICKQASRLLEQSGRSGALDGYQSGNPKRTYMLVAAIWSAVTGLALSYAEPPASFERNGQKVRSPKRVREEGLATCLDSALLFASAIEAVGLNPVVIFATGHAFVGAWLVDKSFPSIEETDVIELRKAIAARELVVFETTLVTTRPVAGFEQAIKNGQNLLREENELNFIRAIDIKRARFAGIHPLASHLGETSGNVSEEVQPAALPTEPDFGLLPGEESEEDTQTPMGRIDRWQRKLLDLTLRNRLLNFKDTKQTVPVCCTDLPKLEDILADGGRLKLISLKDENPVGLRDERLYRDQHGRDINENFSLQALEKKQVCIPLTGNEMKTRLTTLYRKAQSELIEGGANTLFLAVGFLRWKKTETDASQYRAPLLILPVKLERRSAQSDFCLVHHEDDIKFNATLLELLKRDFRLAIPQLEGDLPVDHSGIDVPKIFSIMRGAVRDVPGFEVVEEAAISTFSFAKYLMWKDLVDRTDDLRNNRLVRHLIDCPEMPFPTACDGACLPLPNEVDRRLAPADLLTPLPADSSQLAAVIAAMEGQDFIVIGPPGTGKSQTIANMIAQCLAVGKRVLFVAEKSAALDVVYRRLRSYGLGDVCLELHSNKADRKRVLNQLGASWGRVQRASDNRWFSLTNGLRIKRDKLNAYVEQLHARGSHGFSVFKAIGIVIGSEASFKLSFNSLDAHDEIAFDRLSQIAQQAGETYTRIQHCNSFDSIATSEWSFAWQDRLLSAAALLKSTIPPLLKKIRELSRELSMPSDADDTKKRIEILKRFVEIVRVTSEQNFSRTIDAEIDQLEEAVQTLGEAVGQVKAARSGLKAQYDDEAIEIIPIDDLDRQWREANSKMWPFSVFARRRVRKTLQSYAKSGCSRPEVEISPVRKLQKNIGIIKSSSLFGLPFFQGEETDCSQLRTYLSQSRDLQHALVTVRTATEDVARFGDVVGALVRSQHDQSQIIQLAEEFVSLLEKYESALQSYCDLARGELQFDSLSDLEQRLTDLLSQHSYLADWAKWVAVKSEAQALGLSPLITALEDGMVISAKSEFQAAYFRWWLPLALDASPELCGFRHWTHESLIKEFREFDEAVRQKTPEQVLERVFHDLPHHQRGIPRRSELGTLNHQLGLQRPSLPIRKLIESLPSVFSKLAPCVLMSPLSVAQYLPANQAQFDVIIFDEASQITTWDAVGAIARAKQTIIVGDPKQLPPTNFFGRTDDEDQDDLLEYEKDLPSILDEALASGLPRILLNWHYRSKDEALIAFSNHHYYNDELITFPSPKTKSDAIVFHKNDGSYLRGTARTNVEEARKIVEFSVNRMMVWLDEDEDLRPSLGVITFNIQQQELILNLFDDARRKAPELEWFFSEERDEPVIVKNLENIQGDERDIMCFSITFGKDLAGKISANFGALNKDGGEKRLNVAVTRAREELHIFSSICADDIDISRTKATGVSHLKNFLDYAQMGPVAIPSILEGSVGEAESPFEEAVLKALNSHGWDARPQIGVSGFRIDIGVVHPDHAGAFIAGIECDGATYHSSATARDRDKIREGVLRNLGWSIIRIWSTDWFMNPDEAYKRVDDALNYLLEESRRQMANKHQDSDENDLEQDDSQACEAVGIIPSKESLQNDPHDDEGVFAASPDSDHEPQASLVRGYEAASEGVAEGYPYQPDPTRFFDDEYTSTLVGMISSIVEHEGPIELGRLARQIAREHGWQRTGANIRKRIESCVGENEIRFEGETAFVWSPDSFKKHMEFRSDLDRNTFEISRSEIFGLIAAHPELLRSRDRVRDLAQLMGIQRLSKPAQAYLSETLALYFMPK